MAVQQDLGVSTLQHQRRADYIMHAGQCRNPFLLEDVDARVQYTTGQTNAGVQCGGCPSHAVQLQ